METVGSNASEALRRRRWPYAASGLVLLLAVALALVWLVWLPGYRPELRAGEWYGIDVSHHQGPIDWERVAADGISFAYIKATEGGDFLDPRFDENWAAAGQAGLERGAYHFFTLCTSGEEQARNFLRAVPHDRDALPPAVDLELTGNCSSRPERKAVLRELSTFLRLVEAATGDVAVLYVRDDFEEVYRVRLHLGRPLWHPRFLLRPEVDGWLIWQVGSFAKVAGISGGVDLNVMRRVREQTS